DAMTQTPVEVPDALFGKLREKFTDAQLVELTATLAWENYRARFDDAFGVEAEGFTQGSYCAMAALGAARAQTQHDYRRVQAGAPAKAVASQEDITSSSTVQASRPRARGGVQCRCFG